MTVCHRPLLSSLCLPALLAALLSACGGGGGGGGGGSSPPPAPTYTVGGSVSGLTTNGLVLANGADTVALAAGASSFTLPTPLASGASYAVTVKTAPDHAQCSVANANGTVASANVANVAVSCALLTHSVGGSVSGLAGSGLVLRNGNETLAVAAGATTFTFTQPVAETATYAVSVDTQPAGQTCSVSGGSATMGASDVSSVQVTCSALSYHVGGTISGLTASGLVLANGSDTVAAASGDTSFTFGTPVPFGASYTVSVAQQPAGLSCTVGGSFPATMGSADVTNIAVTCSAPQHGLVPFVGRASCPQTSDFSDGQGAAANVPNALSMAFDAAGNLYISEGTLMRLATADGTVSTLAGQAGMAGSIDGTGSAARFQYVNGITTDAAGTVYVADEAAVRTMSPRGVVSTLAGGSGLAGYQEGTGKTAIFNFAIGAARDAAGNLYLAEVNNNIIRKVTPAGVSSTFAGDATQPAGYVNGSGSAARFNQPSDIVIDSQGRLLVADTGNHVIRLITPAGAVSTFAGPTPAAAPGTSGLVDGQGSAARFLSPNRLAISGSDTLYVVDQRFTSGAIGGTAVRMVTPGGYVITEGVAQNYSSLHPAWPVPAGTTLRFDTGQTDNAITGVAASANDTVYVGYTCGVHRILP